MLLRLPLRSNSTGLKLPIKSKEAESARLARACQLTDCIAGPHPPVEADHNLDDLLHAQTAEGWAVNAIFVQAG